MAELTPVTRLEMFLAGEELDPVTRIEKLLAGEALVPVTRQEMYLAAMGGQSVDLPDPVTRLELFLAKAAGMSVETPDPVTRIEMFLSEWSGGSVELTVSGNAPVTLAHAIAHAIVSLTQEGKVTQASTPTPTSPVDIVCNNGVVRYGALGANLLDPSAANTVLGYYINKEDGEIKNSPYNFMFAGYMPVEPGKTYVAYGRAKNGNDLSDYNRVAWYDSNQGWLSGASYTQNQIAVVTAPNNAAYARFSCNPSGGTSDAVTQEIVDSYNWTFAEGTAEITPFVPFVGGIYVDGTPEVLTAYTPLQVYKGTDFSSGYTYPAGADEKVISVSISLPLGTYYVSVPDGYYWMLRRKSGSSGTNIGSLVQAGEMKITSATYQYAIIVRKGNMYPYQTISPETFDGELTICNPTQTASVADLFAVEGYADTQEIIGGTVTHKVGAIVLNGTETGWALSDSGTTHRFRGTKPADCYTPTGRAPIVSTHFVYVETGQALGGAFVGASSYWYFIPTDQTIDTADKWRAWLNENPIIVLYPLAEETTESVAPQPLTTAEGTNTVSVTSNVDPVKLTVVYKGTEEGD